MKYKSVYGYVGIYTEYEPFIVEGVNEAGLAAGLFKGRFHSGKPVIDLYASLILAMLLGRIVGGVATAIFFLLTADTYSVKLWVTGYFVEALPGIVAHLLVVPALYQTLRKAGVIPVRTK